MTFLPYDTSPVDVGLVFWKKVNRSSCTSSVVVPHSEADAILKPAALGEVLQAFRAVTVPRRSRPLKDKHGYSESRYLILMCVCASMWPTLDEVHPEGKTDALFRQTFPWLISPLQSLFYFLTEVTLRKQVTRATSKHFDGHYKHNKEML